MSALTLERIAELERLRAAYIAERDDVVAKRTPATAVGFVRFQVAVLDESEALLALARKAMESSQAERPDGVVTREHREAAIAVAQDQPGACCRRWAESGEDGEQPHQKQRRIAQLLASREAAAFAAGERAGAEPFVALMLWERDDYRSVVVEHLEAQERFTLSYSDEDDGGGSADGDTPSEAARNLCLQLGLLPAGKEQK